LSNFLNIRLKSGALQFAIYTGAIVALLLLGLILYLHSFKILQQNTEINTDNIKATNFGFYETLKENNVTADTLIISNFTDQNQIVKSSSSFWGIFQKTIITSINRTKKFQKCALIGCNFSTKDRLSLYLENTHKPLIVVGNTRIEGNVMIPDQGVQSGYIAGNSYLGNQLIYGNIKFSAQALPKLNKSLVEELEINLTKSNTINSNYVLNDNSKNVNSFLSEVKVIYDRNSFSITQEIAGNFIIRSDDTITIMATSVLKDVVVIAPKIVIEDGVVGNFQAIASNTIQVGKNVNLSYPSALVISEKESEFSEEGKITIDAFSTIKGVVVFISNKDLSNSFGTHLKVEDKTKIIGEVYCEGNFELKGEVWGSVFSHQLVSNTAGTIFINHLYNAKIASTDFPSYYSGILFENQSKNIMKWLY
jgi:cytoskeletal protein CcmA (bactofilin family)